MAMGFGVGDARAAGATRIVGSPAGRDEFGYSLDEGRDRGATALPARSSSIWGGAGGAGTPGIARSPQNHGLGTLGASSTWSTPERVTAPSEELGQPARDESQILAYAVFEALMQQIEHDKEVSLEVMSALNQLIPDESLARAIDLVTRKKITAVTALPSGRTFYKVSGSNRAPYVLFGVMADIPGYCSCPDHTFTVARATAKEHGPPGSAGASGSASKSAGKFSTRVTCRLFCKHAIALRLARALGKLQLQTIEDIRVEEFLVPEAGHAS